MDKDKLQDDISEVFDIYNFDVESGDIDEIFDRLAKKVADSDKAKVEEEREKFKTLERLYSGQADEELKQVDGNENFSVYKKRNKYYVYSKKTGEFSDNTFNDEPLILETPYGIIFLTKDTVLNVDIDNRRQWMYLENLKEKYETI